MLSYTITEMKTWEGAPAKQLLKVSVRVIIHLFFIYFYIWYMAWKYNIFIQFPGQSSFLDWLRVGVIVIMFGVWGEEGRLFLKVRTVLFGGEELGGGRWEKGRHETLWVHTKSFLPLPIFFLVLSTTASVRVRFNPQLLHKYRRNSSTIRFLAFFVFFIMHLNLYHPLKDWLNVI